MGKCVLARQVCPQTSDPTAHRYCPAWWETVAQDAQGNQRVMKGCAWAQLPMYLNEFASKAAGAAEAAQQGRNELALLAEATKSFVLTLHSPVKYVQAANRPAAVSQRTADAIQPPGYDQADVLDHIEDI